jgi:hypothetical protein
MVRYTARVIETIKHPPGRWNTLKVGVFRVEGEQEEQVGEYGRNYSSLYRTFCAFQKDGKDYALYSPHYTATRVMELPSCRDLGGEEPHSYGFCPVDYYVPAYVFLESRTSAGKPYQYRINEPTPDRLEPSVSKYRSQDAQTGEVKWVEYIQRPAGPLQYYDFGFVAGCVWADDSSWKLQYLDLSQVDQGVIRREQRFGYVELAEHLTLRQAVDIIDYLDDPEEEYSYQITVAVRKKFDLRTGKAVEAEPSG